MKKYFYIYTCPDIGEDYYTSEYTTLNALDDLLTDVSRNICFSDCVKINVLEINADGRKLSYVGWRPDMEFAYKDMATGEIVWSRHFPEWDH